jgi:rhamnosyltransferase
MYDIEILNYLRQEAFAYINGHTLGGTNPGLLEAMASTSVVLAHDNVFSREACGDYAIYYDKKHSLCDALRECELMSNEERNVLIQESRKRMAVKYCWKDITKSYENLFESAIEIKNLDEVINV